MKILRTFYALFIILLVSGSLQARSDSVVVAENYLTALYKKDYNTCLNLSVKGIRKRYPKGYKKYSVAIPITKVPKNFQLKNKAAYNDARVITYDVHDVGLKRMIGNLILVLENDSYKIKFCPFGEFAYEYAVLLSPPPQQTKQKEAENN